MEKSFYRLLRLDALGAADGILSMRDTRVLTKLDEQVGYSSISCKFQIMEDDFM